MSTTRFDIAHSALLLLDCQEGVAAGAFKDRASRVAFCGAVDSAILAAQAAGMPCIRVEIEFRPGYPEVSPANAYFTGVRASQRLIAGSDEVAPMAELATVLAPMPRVVKRRIGAFANTDLETLLRGLDCNGLVLAGLITRGAILSTSSHGADLDYRLAVLADACHDPDASVHDHILEHVLAIRAKVMMVGEFEVKASGLKRT